MATGNFLDLMPNSTDPTTVISAQNKGAVKLAQAEMGMIKENAASAVEFLEKTSQVAQEEIQNEQVFRTFLSGVSQEARAELQGTQKVLDMNQEAYAKKAAEYSETARNLAEVSFFSNPVAFIRNKVKAAGQQNDLVNLVNAMNTAKVHQGEVYREANQKIRDYEAEVRNLSFAEHQTRRNELAQLQETMKIESTAKSGILAAADKALFRQQGIKDNDPEAARDKEYLNSILFRKMYSISRNGDDSDYSLEQAKLQQQIFATLSGEEQRALTLGVSRLETLPGLPRLPEETDSQYNQRKLDRDIMALSSTVGTAAVELVSKLGSSSYNQLTTAADKAARDAVMAGISTTIRSPTGVMLPKDSATLKAEQQQALAFYENQSFGDKLDTLKSAMATQLTERARSSTNPPLDFAGASALMTSTNVDPNVVAAFESDAVKQAIMLPEKVTFKPTADIALNLLDVMRNVQLSNGKQMTDAQAAEVVAKYMKASFLADYEMNTSEGTIFKELSRLEPGSTLGFAIPVDISGKKDAANLADPASILNLYVAERRKATIKEQGKQSREFMVNRGIPSFRAE